MSSLTTTASLSSLMQKYYDRLFIDIAKHALVHEQGAQMRPLPGGGGKIVYFTRYTPLAIITAQITEGSNPSAVNLSATTVSATVSEFGSYTTISKLLKLTSLDKGMEGAVEVMAQNAGESRDQMVRNKALVGGTAQLAGGKAYMSLVSITDVLSSTELRKALRTLKANKAQRYDDGYFLGKIGPYSSYDMMGDTTWVNAHVYKDGENLYQGEIGKIFGVRIIETTNPKETANGGVSSADVQHSFVHGKNAIGVTDLEGDSQKVYVKTPGPNSTDNPVDRFSTVGWALSFVPKQLVSDWVIEIKHGATGKT